LNFPVAKFYPLVLFGILSKGSFHHIGYVLVHTVPFLVSSSNVGMFISICALDLENKLESFHVQSSW